MEELRVYLKNNFVGKLYNDKGRLSFSYAQSWLESETREPLSVSLPLKKGEFFEIG